MCTVRTSCVSLCVFVLAAARVFVQDPVFCVPPALGPRHRRPPQLRSCGRRLSPQCHVGTATGSLKVLMSAIYGACNGGNTFKLPHTGIRREMREDGWDI